MVQILAQEEEHANDMHDLLVAQEGRPMLAADRTFDFEFRRNRHLFFTFSLSAYSLKWSSDVCEYWPTSIR